MSTDTEIRIDHRATIAVVFGVLALAALWNHFWVQPREEFLHSVMECMGDDSSEAAYQRCAEKVRSEVSDSL